MGLKSGNDSTNEIAALRGVGKRKHEQREKETGRNTGAIIPIFSVPSLPIYDMFKALISLSWCDGNNSLVRLLAT